MNVLFFSSVFFPRFGGIEQITQALAEGALARGHSVVVATHEPNPDGHEPFPFRVVRHPGSQMMYRLARASDVVVFGGVSLKALTPIVAARRPIVTGHHNWYQIPGRRPSWSGALKIEASRLSRVNVACSRAIAAQLSVPCEVINSFYDDAVFYPEPTVERTGDLIAVGRLVSDKGFDLLIDALSLLAKEGISPRLSIVGEGPEQSRLAEQAARLGVAPQVTFHGRREGADLRKLLCAHSILVIPSRWPEPFGIVVGEGLACGCLPIGSDRGGLPEAIGDCGILFESESPAGLAAAIRSVLQSGDWRAEVLAGAAKHLEPLKKSVAVPRYLDLIEKAARR
jgi:glycosyltransferase involved in cell wall biosynthesis